MITYCNGERFEKIALYAGCVDLYSHSKWYIVTLLVTGLDELSFLNAAASLCLKLDIFIHDLINVPTLTS